ncbi:MAG: Cna B-type domain-containing protein [Firmicutes bacterium]|nr:Cna B-type domain-containing protein [Bacillota bacterium]
MVRKLAFEYNRILLIIFTIIFAVSSFMSGSYAWQSLEQFATNTMQGVVAPTNVKLTKYEKPADGGPLQKRLEGAEFYLYEVVEDKDGETDMEQIGAVYTTNASGEIRLTLPEGDYCFKEITPPMGYTFDDEHGPKYYFQVATGQRSEINVLNVLLTGDLTITKTVWNYAAADGEPTEGQKAKDFTFRVDFGQAGEYEYQVRPLYEAELEPDSAEYIEREQQIPTYTVSSGGTITLKHDQKAVFKNLPVGLSYSVTELNSPGYSISSDGASGNITEEGCVADFTNKYYGGEKGTLKITKVVEDVDGNVLTDDHKEFEFTVIIDGVKVKMKDDGGNPHDVKLSNNQSASWTGIPLGAEYVVTEKDYTGNGYYPEIREYRGQITGEEPVELVFTNVYNPAPGGQGSLTIKKTVKTPDGTAADPDKEFTFWVQAEGLGEKTYTLKAEETITISGIKVGGQYTIRETDWDYYIPKTLEVSGTITHSGEDHFVEFINTKPSYGSEIEQLTVTKVVAGNAPDADKLGKEFEFSLYIDGKLWKSTGYVTKRDGTYEYFTDVETFLVKDGETAQVNNLPVGATYEVVEKNYFGEGYSLSMEKSMGTINLNPAGGAEDVIAVNTFIGSETVDIYGEKTWDWGDNYAGTAKPYPESVIVKLKNVGEGLVVAQQEVTAGTDGRWLYTFHGVPKYNASGEKIVYAVQEVVPKGFSATYTIAEGSGGCVQNIKNTYTGQNKYEPVTVDLPVIKKTVSGSSIPETTFSFVMKNSSSKVIRRAAVTCDGYRTEAAAALGQITYDKTGIYKYTITEINDKASGWTYDTAKYQLTVNVYLGNDGKLRAQKSMTRNGKAWNGSFAEFANSYSGGYVPPGPGPGPDHESTYVWVSGTKTWIHGVNPADARPASIVVKIYGDGKLATQKMITASDGWKYSYYAPKYNALGQLIKYTVEEDPVDGYTTEVVGYDIVNTFIPPVDPDDPGPGDDPDGPGGTDEPGSDKPGSDKSGTDKPGSDKPGSDKPGEDDAQSPEKVPETGIGDFDLLFWVMMMLISGQCMILLILIRKGRIT